MRHAIRGCSLLGLLLGASAALAASKPDSCSPEVRGTWKLESTSQLETTLLRFGADGWANLLSGPSDRAAESYEIVAQVGYLAMPAHAAKYIEFSTRRGNDLFAAGKSRWDIVAHSDQSLTTHAAETANGEQMLWSRVPTQRYFLTLAARTASQQRPAATFVMWSTLGTKLEFEALGVMGTGPSARMGRIPLELAREFSRQSGRAEDVMLRIELNEAEFYRTHRVLEAWDAVLKGNLLARNDPASQLNELLDATLQSTNSCVSRLQVPRVPAEGGISDASVQQRIRVLRQLNDKRHVNDKAFPFDWRPAAVG